MERLKLLSTQAKAHHARKLLFGVHEWGFSLNGEASNWILRLWEDAKEKNEYFYLVIAAQNELTRPHIDLSWRIDGSKQEQKFFHYRLQVTPETCGACSPTHAMLSNFSWNIKFDGKSGEIRVYLHAMKDWIPFGTRFHLRCKEGTYEITTGALLQEIDLF